MLHSVRSERSRRSLLLLGYSVLFIIVIIAIIWVSCVFLSSRGVLSDRLAEVADVIAGGTALLAVLAGLVAIQAYAAATGLPNLKIQVWFAASEKNKPVFQAHHIGNGFLETTAAQQTQAIISLHNKSRYSARSVLIIIKMCSVSASEDLMQQPTSGAIGDDWKIFDFPDAVLGEREIVVQWDMGADGIVRGGAYCRLPDLYFGTLRYNSAWQAPRLEAELIADGGYRRRVGLMVNFIDEGASMERFEVGKVKAWLLWEARRPSGPRTSYPR